MSLLHLPEEAWEKIASFLPAPDLLAYVSTNQILHRTLASQDSFWARQLKAHFNRTSGASDCSKDSFLLYSYAKHLPLVRWYPVREQHPWPTAREGHLCIRLGDFIVLTGGFTEDSTLFVKNIHRQSSWERISPVYLRSDDEDGRELQPSFVYGATLTALDNSRAVRFGGFQSGGYSQESSQLVLVRMEQENRLVTFQVIPCRLRSRRDPRGRAWQERVSRAYHSATLIYNRYLLVVGGMKTNHSVWEPLLLDTHTWTWLDDYSGWWHPAASPRHGHSAIWDTCRRRILVFGGGSGSDLLRSGVDNCEVWGCSLCSVEEIAAVFDGQDACLGKWSLLLRADAEARVSARKAGESSLLSPLELKNLGRCHQSFRVSPDTCILLFGSGAPSTNGVLAYDLVRDCFFRVSKQGPSPLPRFTFAAVYIEEYAYVFVHGGYSSTARSRVTLGDGAVLDLAANLKRPLSLFVASGNVSHSHLTHESAREMSFERMLLRAMLFRVRGREPSESDDSDSSDL